MRSVQLRYSVIKLPTLGLVGTGPSDAAAIVGPGPPGFPPGLPPPLELGDLDEELEGGGEGFGAGFERGEVSSPSAATAPLNIH